MKPIFIANWKMNLSLQEATTKAKHIEAQNYPTQFLLAIPATYLAYFTKTFKKITFCAQDVSVVSGFGAYTGECSADMIKSAGVNYSVIGHSEKRELVPESNRIIRKKAENCTRAGIVPIICIGESLESRQSGHFQEFLLEQLNESIPGNAQEIIIAYEPLWAIGSGIIPTIEEISAIFHFIKSSKDVSMVAKKARLVYGGSVNSGNYREILNIPDASGVMLGSASLKETELDLILNL
ncbi:MAG: triose-phosphate isomerase [Rickettsiales bacterium]|nr:MAG: triose-phosphate isomerase [Rickettsiales bacterium]